MLDNEKIILKLILAGDSNVGKSSFFYKLQNKEFELNLTSTVGVDFYSMNFELLNKNIKAIIWDTAGQEKFRCLIRTYFKGVNGVILMYDVTEPNSLKNIKNWLKIIDEENRCNHKHPIILLGNKCDLNSLINKDDLEVYLENKNINHIEISCITEMDLEEIIKILVTRIISELDINRCKCIKKSNSSDEKSLYYNNNRPTLNNMAMYNTKNNMMYSNKNINNDNNIFNNCCVIN